jgi:hypothetical protein
MSPPSKRTGWVATALLLAVGLVGCTSTGSEGGSTLLGLSSSAATAPVVAQSGLAEVRDCPAVDVVDGGAALRVGSGQITIANVARECGERPDGAIVVKVGVEGRLLLGPGGGGSARADAPVTITIKRNDRVFASRSRRVPVSVVPGEFGGNFVVVEDNLVVPPGTDGFEIVVGLGAGPAARGRPARAQRGGNPG